MIGWEWGILTFYWSMQISQTVQIIDCSIRHLVWLCRIYEFLWFLCRLNEPLRRISVAILFPIFWIWKKICQINIMKSKGHDLLFNMLIEQNGKTCILDNILNFYLRKNRMKFRQIFTKIDKDFSQCYGFFPCNIGFK